MTPENGGDSHPLPMNERTTSGTWDDVGEPERDLEGIAEVLNSVQAGDRVKVGIGVNLGAGNTGGTIKGNVLGVDLETEIFDRRVNILNEVDDEGWGRMYITGCGHADLDEWEIVSVPYYVPDGVADASDLAAHGWVVGAEVLDDAE